MKLREQVGQLLILGLDGTELGIVQAAWLRMLQPAGVVLFQRNIESASQTQSLLRAIQDTARSPMLHAVDLEGGTVDRLRDAFAPMPSAGRVSALHSVKAAQLHGKTIGQACRAFGFSTTFALSSISPPRRE